jgi:amino acid transporter
MVAIIAICVFTLVNIRGVKETGRTQTALVIILLVLLGVFVAFGLFSAKATIPIDLSTPTGFLGILRASAFIFIVYLGGEAIAVAQAEIKEPGKTIPRAIILSCLALIIIYTCIAYITLRIVPPNALAGQTSPLAYVAQQFMGNIGVGLITVAGIIAALTSINTSIMAQSRVAYALARDGYFPKSFFSVHKHFSTPHVAILVGSVFVAAFAATGIVNFVTYATDFGFIIGFVFVNLSLIKLRRDKPSLVRPFKVPFYPLTPILGIATSLLLMFFMEPSTLVMGAELFLFCLLAYYLRMVGYGRLCLAVGGMNFGVSAFAALLALLTALDIVPLMLSATVRMIVILAAVIVSSVSLAAGILDMKVKNSRE